MTNSEYKERLEQLRQEQRDKLADCLQAERELRAAFATMGKRQVAIAKALRALRVADQAFSDALARGADFYNGNN